MVQAQAQGTSSILQSAAVSHLPHPLHLIGLTHYQALRVCRCRGLGGFKALWGSRASQSMRARPPCNSKVPVRQFPDVAFLLLEKPLSPEPQTKNPKYEPKASTCKVLQAETLISNHRIFQILGSSKGILRPLRPISALLGFRV